MKRVQTLLFVAIAIIVLGVLAFFMYNSMITNQMRSSNFVHNYGWPTSDMLGYGTVWEQPIADGEKTWQVSEIIRCSNVIGLEPTSESIAEAQGFMYCLLYAIPGQEPVASSFESLADRGVALAYIDVGVDSKKRVNYAYIRLLGINGNVMYFPLSSTEEEISAQWQQLNIRQEKEENPFPSENSELTPETLSETSS